MIPFDFEYYRPETLDEAFACFARLSKAGKGPVWYAGGTELISMARVGSLSFGAAVDLKAVPECTFLGVEKGRLRLGAALTLTAIHDSGLFPLLGRTVGRIADHTIQGKITLGGNLAGTIQYREAALPLLLCGAKAQVMTAKGLEERPFPQVFPGRLALDQGEFLVSVDLPEAQARRPHCHAKRTKLDKIDYPLVTLCAVSEGGEVRMAVSGYGPAPALLTEDLQPTEGLSGTPAYKKFVLETMAAQARAELEV